MDFMPTEILIHIFDYLSLREQIKCRRVCWRWRNVVDLLTSNEKKWKKLCEKDFKEVYKVAYSQRMPGLNWSQIYRSLTLWSQLNNAVETRDDFACATLGGTYMDEIHDFHVLSDGIIGIQMHGSIKYFNIFTLKQCKLSSVLGSYLQYAENEFAIIVLAHNNHLFILHKLIRKTRTNYPPKPYVDVKSFLLVENYLLYITILNEIYLCNLDNNVITSSRHAQVDSRISSISFVDGQINILTFYQDIFTVVDKRMNFISNISSSNNILHELKQYNLLENLDWYVYYQWMLVLKQYIPQGPLRDIVVMKIHGDMVFVGSNWGVLTVYYAPYHNNEFDLFNSTPIRQYSFLERFNSTMLFMSPIIQINVIEGEDSHTVLVATPKKMVLLSFIHIYHTSPPLIE